MYQILTTNFHMNINLQKEREAIYKKIADIN